MFNPKKVAIASAVGFTLAFLVGLISGVKFGFILLRSLVSAIICGGGAVAVKFVCEKYLLEGVSLEGMVSEPEGNAEATVDAFVNEDELPDDDMAPTFTVTGYGRRSSEDSGFISASVAEVTSPSIDEHSEREHSLEDIVQPAVSLEPDDFDAASAPVVEAPEPAEIPEIVAAPSTVAPVKNSGLDSASSKDSDLDDLPSFRDIPNEVAAVSYRESAPTVDGQDAHSVAMAIRTMLERDK